MTQSDDEIWIQNNVGFLRGQLWQGGLYLYIWLKINGGFETTQSKMTNISYFISMLYDTDITLRKRDIEFAAVAVLYYDTE